MRFIDTTDQKKNIEIRTGASAIISNEENEILLEKRKDCNLWGIPGGRLEPGESIVDACTREFLEETGLKIDIVGLVGIYTGPKKGFLLREYPDALVQVIDIVLRGERVSGELIVSDESYELHYFSQNDLPAMVPNTEVILKNYFENTVGIV